MWLALSGVARAQSTTTQDSLERLQEMLELRLDDGRLSADALRPAVLVSAMPLDPATQSWYATRVLEVLQRALGPGSLRLCEACMAPRAYVGTSQLTMSTGPMGLDEVARLDDLYRGSSESAKVGIWVDENLTGVSARIVDLRTGAVLYAQNVDPTLEEVKRSGRSYTMAEEAERRARGDSLTQAFVDVAIYPGQHASFDWTDQWGETNRNLSGVTLSLWDPLMGIGACHYRVLKPLNMAVGGKVIMALPTAALRALSDTNEDVVDPLLTIAGVLRVPFGRSNYGALLTASTNGQVGVGISLMNISLVPVIP